MQLINKITGICLWWEPGCLIRAVGRRIDMSLDDGLSFNTITYLDLGATNNQKIKTKLGARLFRLNPKHCIKVSAHEFVLVAAGLVFILDTQRKSAVAVSEIMGKRPLRMAFDGENLFYGEYRGNPHRQDINVYRSGDFGRHWEVCHTFSSIRHVHGIYCDKLTNSVWVTTGDYGEEAAIWKTDASFSKVTPVLSGNQQTRAIDLLFRHDGLFFGTDAPEEVNHVYFMSRDASVLKQMSSVAGPVFHAVQLDNVCYLSTACEPSMSNNYTHAVLYKVKNDEVKEIFRLKKDRWSMKYFQYGQILFPSGPGVKNQLWCSSFACEKDQTSFHFREQQNNE